MSNQNSYHEIEKVKHQIFDATLFVGSLLGTMAFLLGPNSEGPWYLNFDYVTDILFLITLICIYLFRKRLPLKTKSLFVLFLLFGFFITDAAPY